ncbi:hypothetical protein EV421DRAFT_1730253 [Armillaria borealis]|uniref:Uncharacterized protein n=1 Tax=Armillaria borealis TaxID=47425 RepID=A0AA39K200_9AGAR|nr:hypothetical protein EV421DRAFT_1730253 [Armillaria borealis]
MFRRDDAASTPSATETEQASDSYPADTSSGENASTLPPATTDTTSTPSPAPVPSSTGRGLVVVETSTPPESHSSSTLSADPTLYQPDTPTSSTLLDTTSGSRSVDIPTSTIASSSVYSILPVSDVAPIPTSSGSASADIPSSTTLFYSIVTAANPTPTIAPVSISPWYSILPVSDTTTISSASSYPTSSSTMLLYSIVTAADPVLASISPWYSILPVSDVTAIPTPSSSTSADTYVSSSTSLFYSIVTVADPAPASISPLYSILPVSDITTISTSSGSASADTSIPSSTALFYSIMTAADPTLTPAASILPVSDTTTTTSYLSPPSVLPVSESTTPDLAPESTLVLPAIESSTLIDSILRLVDTSTPTAVPTSTLIFPGITPTIGPSKFRSNYPVAVTTDTPAKDVYHSTTVPITLAESLSTEEAPTTSSQRINNLALQPTADAGASSTVLGYEWEHNAYVCRVGDGTSGPGEGPSSGDTRSHHALPISIILGSVLAGVVLILLAVFVVVRRRRRRRVARWHRLPYEPALDTSRHSSRFLNPFTDIDDDWSIIASEVERPMSTTTTASTLAFAPSREDGDDLASGVYTTRRPAFGFGGWR